MRLALGYVTVGDDYRRMIACYDGEHGQMATRERVRQWIETVGRSLDDDAMTEYDECDLCHPTAPPDPRP